MNSNKSPHKTGQNAAKKPKLECAYGEKCYRKKIEHFQEYNHSHLNDLLKNMGEKIVIPAHYIPKISYKSLAEQLQFVRDLHSPNGVVQSVKSKSPRNKVDALDSAKLSSGSEPNTSRGDSSTTSPTRVRIMDPLPAKAMEAYKKEVMTRVKVPVKEKMEAAAPYNFFLTTIKDSPETHRELLSISFPELFDPYFGELEASLQINFMVEMGFLLAQYQITGYGSKPLTLLYGQSDCDLSNKFTHFLTHAEVKPPSSFGSHHSKMMIFRYTNKSVRVVISTANLVESDWENRTQGLWISPECPALPLDHCDYTGAGESATFFKRDLLDYLTAYRLPILQPWLEAIKEVDMSHVRVFFIGSVPGSHTVYRYRWGQLKLATLLKDYVSPNEGQVIAQCSSIGSLGPKPDSWLQGEILTALGNYKGTLSERPKAPTHLKLIYPTFSCISNSYDGLLGGGCLPYPRATHRKQEWLIAFLCDWYSTKRHRTQAPPHIKSYCRISENHEQMYYFVLTSANMSKAAWGQQAKSGSLNILSYEAGILFAPQIMVNKDTFPLSADEDGIKAFPLPYDLPLVPYTHADVPWFIDNLS